MDPRPIIYTVGVLFWLAFAGMTAYVIGNDGLTPLTFLSLVILLLIGAPLFGGLREK